MVNNGEGHGPSDNNDAARERCEGGSASDGSESTDSPGGIGARRPNQDTGLFCLFLEGLLSTYVSLIIPSHAPEAAAAAAAAASMIL